MATNKILIPTFISSEAYAPARVLPHIYFYNGLKDCERYYMQSGSGFVAKNQFPYFDNYSGETTTTSSLSLLFYNEQAAYGTAPSQSLYSQYWAKYVELLYNPRTRLISAEAIIPLADYFHMELNDIVQFRGNYYHLRAINDYNLANGECSLQLLGPILDDALQFVAPLPAPVSTTTSTTTTAAPTTTTTSTSTTTTTLPPTTTTTGAPTTTTTTLASTTTTTTLQPVWYSLYTCTDGSTQNSTQKTIGTFVINERVTFGGAFWYVLAELNSNPGGPLINVVTVGGASITGCPDVITTTTTTTLPPLSVTATAGCAGSGIPGTGTVLANTFTGGSGTYMYLGIGTSEFNAISDLNNVATRITLGGNTSHTYTGLSNGNYWVAIEDSLGTEDVSNGVTVSCNATTTTTTTTTTLQTVWYQLTSCADGSTVYSTNYLFGAFSVNERVSISGGALFTIAAQLTSNPGGPQQSITTTGQTGCPATTTTTTTTTLAGVNFNISYACSAGTATVTIDSFSGGSGVYQASDTVYTSQVNAYNGTFVDATAPKDYFSVSDGTWWVAVRDKNNTGNVIAKSVSPSCATTTTTTIPPATTTTTTTGAPTFAYLRYDVDGSCNTSNPQPFWSYNSYSSGFYFINGGGTLYYLSTSSHSDFTNQITSVSAQSCTPPTTTTAAPTTTTTTAAPPACRTYDIIGYNTDEYVDGTYTNCSGFPDSFSFFGGPGVVGSICAQTSTVYITTGNGAANDVGAC
jgi:hypothetical protein